MGAIGADELLAEGRSTPRRAGLAREARPGAPSGGSSFPYAALAGGLAAAVAAVEIDAVGHGTLTQSVPLINADQAHTAGVTGSGIMVAVLDLNEVLPPIFGHVCT